MTKQSFTNLQYLSFGVIVLLVTLLIFSNFTNNLNIGIQEVKTNNDTVEPNSENDLSKINIDNFRNLNDNILIESDFRKIDSLDKIYNPLEYPYQSHPYYNDRHYPSDILPPSVIECGRRNLPCYGWSQKVINNNYPIKLVSDNNIAPNNIALINMRTRGPEGEPQQVGTLFKLTPGNKDIYPLFGRKKFPNDSKWEYYTIIGDYGSKVPVKPLRNYEEIGTNDIVQLFNYPGNYRATIYKREDLQYIPYV